MSLNVVSLVKLHHYESYAFVRSDHRHLESLSYIAFKINDIAVRMIRTVL